VTDTGKLRHNTDNTTVSEEQAIGRHLQVGFELRYCSLQFSGLQGQL